LFPVLASSTALQAQRTVWHHDMQHLLPGQILKVPQRWACTSARLSILPQRTSVISLNSRHGKLNLFQHSVPHDLLGNLLQRPGVYMLKENIRIQHVEISGHALCPPASVRAWLSKNRRVSIQQACD
jgi:hypothetical protein